MKIIGMVHLDSLPGYPNCDLNKVLEKALADAKALESGGVDAILIENEADDPHQKTVGPETVAAMTLLIQKIKESTKLPLGICVLFNSYKEALAIAKVTGANFVRVPVFTEAIVTGCGIIEGNPCEVIKYRKQIGSDAVKIYADVQVKHAAQLVNRPISESAAEINDYGADGLIVTGRFTGDEPDLTDLKKVREACPDAHILIGSGTTPKNVKTLAKYANSAIVGTYFKENNRIREEKVRKLIKTLRSN